MISNYPVLSLPRTNGRFVSAPMCTHKHVHTQMSTLTHQRVSDNIWGGAQSLFICHHKKHYGSFKCLCLRPSTCTGTCGHFLYPDLLKSYLITPALRHSRRLFSLLSTFTSCQHSWQLWRLRCISALNGLLNAHQLVLLWQYYNVPDNVQLSLSSVVGLKANSSDTDLCNIKHLYIGEHSDYPAVTVPTNEATVRMKDRWGGKEAKGKAKWKLNLTK